MFKPGDKVRLRTLDEFRDNFAITRVAQVNLIAIYGNRTFIVKDAGVYLDTGVEFVEIWLDNENARTFNAYRFVHAEDTPVFNLDGLEALI